MNDPVNYNNIDEQGYELDTLSAAIRFQMKRDGTRFWAGDNISEYLDEDKVAQLIKEATDAFEGVLKALLIDTENDPNSKGTAKRLAKM